MLPPCLRRVFTFIFHEELWVVLKVFGYVEGLFYTIFIVLWAILGLFVASCSPKTSFIFNYGLIVGKDNMRVTYMGMKTTINPKPGHYMKYFEPLNNILGAVLASRCITDLNHRFMNHTLTI